MIRRVTRISPWQAGKFCAVLYFIMGLVFAVPVAFVTSATGQGAYGMGVLVGIPFGYAIAGLIFVPLGCLIFNFVAKLVGGLEFEVVERDANTA
jgi:hypothetical protein